MLKVTVDGSADIGWIVEIFRDNEPVAVWSGHPDAPTEADAMREALTEWEHPTQSPEDRAAAENLRLGQKRLEYAVRQAKAQAAIEKAAAAEAEQRRADEARAAEARRVEVAARIAAEDAAARELNAPEQAPASED